MENLANGQVSIEKLSECYALHHPDCEYCENCFAVFIWSGLPDEAIKTVREPRGEFWGAPCSEEVVIGWTCPNCDQFNPM